MQAYNYLKDPSLNQALLFAKISNKNFHIVPTP